MIKKLSDGLTPFSVEYPSVHHPITVGPVAASIDAAIFRIGRMSTTHLFVSISAVNLSYISPKAPIFLALARELALSAPDRGLGEIRSRQKDFSRRMIFLRFLLYENSYKYENSLIRFFLP